MTKRLVLALLALTLLVSPMLACGQIDYAPEDGVTVQQAQHTIRMNECSFECDGWDDCIQRCVNR